MEAGKKTEIDLQDRPVLVLALKLQAAIEKSGLRSTHASRAINACREALKFTHDDPAALQLMGELLRLAEADPYHASEAFRVVDSSLFDSFDKKGCPKNAVSYSDHGGAGGIGIPPSYAGSFPASAAVGFSVSASGK